MGSTPKRSRCRSINALTSGRVGSSSLAKNPFAAFRISFALRSSLTPGAAQPAPHARSSSTAPAGRPRAPSNARPLLGRARREREPTWTSLPQRTILDSPRASLARDDRFATRPTLWPRVLLARSLQTIGSKQKSSRRRADCRKGTTRRRRPALLSYGHGASALRRPSGRLRCPRALRGSLQRRGDAREAANAVTPGTGGRMESQTIGCRKVGQRGWGPRSMVGCWCGFAATGSSVSLFFATSASRARALLAAVGSRRRRFPARDHPRDHGVTRSRVRVPHLAGGSSSRPHTGVGTRGTTSSTCRAR